jgi:hypothetical protein
MAFLQSVLADRPFSIFTIRNDKTGEILQDGSRATLSTVARKTS